MESVDATVGALGVVPGVRQLPVPGCPTQKTIDS
jgi:hypothetical protein